MHYFYMVWYVPSINNKYVQVECSSHVLIGTLVELIENNIYLTFFMITQYSLDY